MPAGGRDSPYEVLDEFEQTAPKPKRWLAHAGVAGLLALVAFQGFLMRSWIEGEARPPSWDQAIHLEIAHDYSTLLAQGDVRGAMRLAPKPGMPPFPPLYELTLLPWLGSRDAASAALWANYVWLALLIVAVWGVGWLYAGPLEGLAAAALVSCAPEAQWLARNHLPDLPLAAWIAASYFALAWSAGFLRWGGSLLFGACVAAAFLTKWSAWTYLFPAAVIWTRALSSSLTRRRALVSFGLAVAACSPWYLPHVPILLPRLVEASADQAVPVWRGWAALAYVWILNRGLDTPFWILGAVALVAPRLRKGREDNWLIPAWFAVAFVFWTIVPNRQMRFLFPAVAPLALLLPGVFPRATAALCAWQLFSAANYTGGWVKPLMIDFGKELSFLTADPPAKQDWRVVDILREAERLREPGRPFSNLTVLANHERFNGATFNWERKRAGVPGIRIRGVNSRYCELSEFVAIKGGSLGPAAVVNQLPEVRQAMLDPGSWFRRGYEEVARFKLADDSEATLFQRRRRAGAPWKQSMLPVAALETPQYSIRGGLLIFGPWDPKRGAYSRVQFQADALILRGLEIHGVKAVLEGVDLLPLESREGLYDVRLLRLERMTLESAQVRADGLAALLARRAPALSELSVRLDGTAAVEAVVKGRLRAALEAELKLEPAALHARLTRAKVGPVSLPLPESVAAYRLSFEANPELPFELRVGGLTLKDGTLSIP